MIKVFIIILKVSFTVRDYFVGMYKHEGIIIANKCILPTVFFQECETLLVIMFHVLKKKQLAVCTCNLTYNYSKY